MDLPDDRLTLTVTARRELARDICEFTLARPDGGALPGFTPGAHVTVQTPSGAMRRYSLVNDGEDPEVYTIAVKREAQGRGGSASMHDALTEGAPVEVDPPENDFELVQAPKYLLIAGGIGITPILSMARHMAAEGKPFELIYCTRTPEDTAYLDEVAALPRTVVHHDNGDMDAFYDFWDHFEDPGREPGDCCGPAPGKDEV
jgi:phthalate 4,5-dioxygenase reductase subunit